MYEQMKAQACQYQGSITSILEQFKGALEFLKNETENQLKEIQDKITTLSGRAQQKAEAMKRELENRLQKAIVWQKGGSKIHQVVHDFKNLEPSTCEVKY